MSVELARFVLTPSLSLLLIIFNNLKRTNFRLVRVKADLTKSASLTQEVPALIELNLDLLEPLAIGLGVCPLLVRSMFFCDKALNMIEDHLILDFIVHPEFSSAT
jgi:hypothetical protein